MRNFYTSKQQLCRGLLAGLITVSICLGEGQVSGDDRQDTSSVIPIRETSADKVGTPLAVRVLEPGNSNRRQKSAAVESFPLHLMPAQNQRIARDILNNVSLYRRLPKLELESDRRCYQYFIEHPDVAVSIWRAMEISNVQMTRRQECVYDTDTLDGTRGTVMLLLNTPQHCIVTCHGEFKSPALKRPIQASAMMHLQPTFHPSGKVTHQLDLYVAFPSTAVDVIARLISPVSNRIADRNFEEVSLFVELMSKAMARQPGWVEQIASELQGVRSEDVDKLLSVTAATYVDALRAEGVDLVPVRAQNATLPTQIPELPIPPLAAETELPLPQLR